MILGMFDFCSSASAALAPFKLAGAQGGWCLDGRAGGGLGLCLSDPQRECLSQTLS